MSTRLSKCVMVLALGVLLSAATLWAQFQAPPAPMARGGDDTVRGV